MMLNVNAKLNRRNNICTKMKQVAYTELLRNVCRWLRFIQVLSMLVARRGCGLIAFESREGLGASHWSSHSHLHFNLPSTNYSSK